MSQHRKRRHRRRSVLGKKGTALFCGVSLIMLVLILAFILPRARHQHISRQTALLLSLLLWVASVFAVWACLRSRRRRYPHSHREHVPLRPNYEEFEGK